MQAPTTLSVAGAMPLGTLATYAFGVGWLTRLAPDLATAVNWGVSRPATKNSAPSTCSGRRGYPSRSEGSGLGSIGGRVITLDGYLHGSLNVD